ncbi:TPA: replication initiation protein [Yersinia enterocolitica]|jgi:plasmid replication initiation protein|uniref:replication initiation protein n=1 Tax=Yersinia rohdei TaxID=29485 RepID=UPI0025AA6AE1|nr:replication initiation protein [Yersinia rohdei]EKN4724229.1 replication initiation protein [Yersinia enterocolitica]EKN4736337.1 replication initiation protein [Yersinia enterocolitica]MDN0096924.1 replication initiation protein [Yersinia rohdei]HDU2654169.1 replication initiation protein [Yersinia enterocolitica]HEM8997825.1 replication initiation protein [Yersinia enterocolitica]
MSELVVFKANELAISRYDLTEHETKLILCCVALLNPTIENPTIAERTITFTYQQYAQMMGLTHDNAYQRLKSSTRELMTRTVEIIYPTGAISERIFQWVNYAEFNRETQSIRIVFSEYILPYLFQLKRFIKYNLEHVKAFENKYSMRVYEWLLKELTQRKTHKANIEISIDEFKFMMMLENHKSYDLYKEFNRKILTPVTNDLNTYSNMTLGIEKRGRPADTLIFQVELDKQIDLVTELAKDSILSPKSASITPESNLHSGLRKTLHDALTAKIQLTGFESKFLHDMQIKHDLNGSFSWLTSKQRTTLEKILAKYGNI